MKTIEEIKREVEIPQFSGTLEALDSLCKEAAQLNPPKEGGKMTYTDDFTKLISDTRKTLGESQTEFGKRFDVSHASVSMWESGETEAPYRVLYFCLHQPNNPPNHIEEKA